MKLFAGLSRTDYEDVFRAVGALIDERGWSNVSLMEVDEGLVVQVMVKADQREMKPRLETYLLTDTDLDRVLREAVLRRQKREGDRRAATLPPAAGQPAAASPPPAPSRMIEGMLASRAAAGGAAMRPAAATPPAPPPAPPNGSRAPARDSSADFSAVASQVAQIAQRPAQTAPSLPILPTREEPAPPPPPDEEAPFAPAPMRLSAQAPASKIDTGAARAAVVMAHIVAARLKSGVPITSDDPDLASLLEQVRALDEAGIGKG